MVRSLKGIRVADWKLIEEGASYCGWHDQPLQPFNIKDHPHGITNLAAERPDKVTEQRERLAYHTQFAREPEEPKRIPSDPPAVYGKVIESVFGQEIKEKLPEPEMGRIGTPRLEVPSGQA